MAIALPEVSSLQFLRELKEFGVIARLVRDEGGDLAYTRINGLQHHEHAVRVAFANIMEDVGAGFTDVIVRYLNDRGVPGTAGQINTNVQTLGTAMTAWETSVMSVVNALSSDDLVWIRSNTNRGEVLKTIHQKDFIPSAQASGLKASAELAALITALEALGA
jgi:hypothetical protein